MGIAFYKIPVNDHLHTPRTGKLKRSPAVTWCWRPVCPEPILLLLMLVAPVAWNLNGEMPSVPVLWLAVGYSL